MSYQELGHGLRILLKKGLQRATLNQLFCICNAPRYPTNRKEEDRVEMLCWQNHYHSVAVGVDPGMRGEGYMYIKND